MTVAVNEISEHKAPLFREFQPFMTIQSRDIVNPQGPPPDAAKPSRKYEPRADYMVLALIDGILANKVPVLALPPAYRVSALGAPRQTRNCQGVTGNLGES